MPEEGGGHLGGLVVSAHTVGQTGVGVTRHVTLGQSRDLLQEGTDFHRACRRSAEKKGKRKKTIR